MDIKVAQDIGDMAIDGAAADEKDLCNLTIRLPASDQIEHVTLALGQRGCDTITATRFPGGLLGQRHDRISLG